MKKIFILLIIILTTGVIIFFVNPFKSPSSDKSINTFSIEEGANDDDVVTLKLRDDGFIKSSFAFNLALTLKNKHNQISPGGYYISKNMDAFALANKLTSTPDLKWLTIVPGNRKEQIGEKLQKILNWNDQQVKDWNNTYAAMDFDHFEGVYFPDTYLIPTDSTGLEVADRIIAHFNEVFAPYEKDFSDKDIQWTTGLKIASIIQREAAGPSDMKLISGIIWNRLLKGQKLQIDATIQYAKGKTDGNWWPPVFSADIKNIDSPYNTYQHVGLPPHPISEPSISAIAAALNPEITDCLYYLHDRFRQIHCSKTYEDHLKNIDKYLNQ